MFELVDAEKGLAHAALERAVRSRNIVASGLVHHTDRGSPLRQRRLPRRARYARHDREHEPQG
jgi:hypothetical protein